MRCNGHICRMRGQRVRHGAVVLGYALSFALTNPSLPFAIQSASKQPSALSTALGLESSVAAAATLSAYSTTKLLTGSYVARLAERHGPSSILVISLFGLAVCTAISGLDLTLDAHFMLRAIFGVFGSNGMLLQSWVAQMTSDSMERQELYSDAHVMWATGTVIGGAFVGLVTDDRLVCSFSGAAFALFSCVILVYITMTSSSGSDVTARHRPRHRLGSATTAEAGPSELGLKDTVMAIGTTPGLQWVPALLIVEIATPRLDHSSLVSSLGYGVRGFGVVGTIASLASAAMIILGLRPAWVRALSMRQTVVYCHLVQCVLLLLMPLVSMPYLAALVVVKSLTFSILEPAEKTLWASLAPMDHTTSFIGFLHTVRGLAQTSGTFIASYTSRHDPAYAYYWSAACSLATSALFRHVQPKDKRE